MLYTWNYRELYANYLSIKLEEGEKKPLQLRDTLSSNKYMASTDNFNTQNNTGDPHLYHQLVVQIKISH